MKLKIVANNKEATLLYKDLKSGDVFLYPARERVLTEVISMLDVIV